MFPGEISLTACVTVELPLGGENTIMIECADIWLTTISASSKFVNRHTAIRTTLAFFQREMTPPVPFRGVAIRIETEPGALRRASEQMVSRRQKRHGAGGLARHRTDLNEPTYGLSALGVVFSLIRDIVAAEKFTPRH